MKRAGAYVIDWLDHADLGAEQAWTDTKEIDTTPPLIRTVGFVVRETPQSLVVSHTLHDGECSTPFLILRSCVLSMKPIRLPAMPRSAKAKPG